MAYTTKNFHIQSVIDQWFVFGIALLVTLPVYVLSQETTTTFAYRDLSVDSAKTIIIDKNEKILIIDVRTPSEYRGMSGHLPGAVLKPLGEINDWYKEFLPQQNEAIWVVCQSGHRSAIASRFLVRHGFSRVSNIIGGMLAWNRKNFPVARSNLPGKDEK